MRYATFSEDFKELHLSRNPASAWKYMLFNQECCSIISPNQKDVFITKSNKDNNRIARRDIFVRNTVTGKFFSIINKTPDIVYDKYECIYNVSYIEINAIYEGIQAISTIFLPRHGQTEAVLVSLKNISGKPKKIKVFSFAEFETPILKDDKILSSVNFNEAYYSKECRSIVAYQRNNPVKNNDTVSFLYSSLAPCGFDCNKKKVIGNSLLYDKPGPIRVGRASNSFACGEEMVGLLASEQELVVDGELEFTVLSGMTSASEQLPLLASDSPFERVKESIKAQISRYGKAVQLRDELIKVVSMEEKFYQRQSIETPQIEVSQFMNLWVKKHLLFMVTWSKSFLPEEVWLSRQVLNLTGYVYIASNEQMREFIGQLYNTANELDYFNSSEEDKLSFRIKFIELVCKYLIITKDYSFLEKKFPWSGDQTLIRIFTDEINFINGNVGEHGLVLVDVLSGKDLYAKLENVPLSFEFYDVIVKLKEICTYLSKKRLIQKLSKYEDKWSGVLLSTTKDSEHFIYAFHETGFQIGSKGNTEGSFFLLPQLCAINSGLVDEKTVSQVYNKVQRKLRTPYGFISLEPAYSQYQSDIAWWTSYSLGVSRNGGIITYENLLKLKCDCLCGVSENIMSTLSSILPVSPQRLMNQDKAVVEPLFLTDSVISLLHPDSEGVSYSGWDCALPGLLYSIFIENLIGLVPTSKGFKFKPALGDDWGQVVFRSIDENKEFKLAVEDNNREHKDVEQVLVNGNELIADQVEVGLKSEINIEVILGNKGENEDEVAQD